MKSLLSFCVDHARGVILVLVATVLVGLYSFTRLPVDAVPDISPVQVQVNTLVKGLAPEEVEKQVTFPLETELAGVPGMEEIRSLSKFGLSQITLIFRDGTDLFRARQMISEKIQAATPSLPSDVAPRLAPMVTGLGEIVFYTVDFKAGAQSPDIPNDRSEQLMELKRIHDLLIKPRLRSVPGVAEINTIGGKERQLLVLASPEKLAGAGLSFREIRDVVAENTENAGGGILSLGGEQVNVRANTRVNQPEEVATLAVKTGPGATALRLSEVAEVQTGSSVRVGAATWNGREALLGTVMMLAGENPRVVARNVEAQILEISTSLPPGVEIRILSNRADLVDRTIATVRNNLTEGAVIVVVVLLLLLGNLRAALIVSLSIPLSFLLAVTGMVPSRISGNLMSLGAVDFGLIVDASVVMVENIVRRLRENQKKKGHPLAETEKNQVILSAAQEVASPMCFGVMIVTIVYVPILALGGIEGKMFHPMALTVMLALLGSLLVGLLGMPALCRFALKDFSHDHDPHWLRSIQNAHRRLYEQAMKKRRMFVGWTAGVFLFSMGILVWMDKEFLPRLDEGAITAHMIRAAGVSLDQALTMQQKSEKVILENIPEVAQIYSKIGTDEAATDPMGVNIADSFLILKPRSKWKGHNNQNDLTQRISELLQKTIPGQSYIFSQPIEMRFNEILEGTRADIAVKIFGDDFSELERIGNEIREFLEKIPGTAEVEFDTLGKAPVLEIKPDRQALLAYDVHAREINDVIATALAGSDVGTVIRGNQRIPVVVRLPEHIRNDLTQIRRLPVPTEDGGTVPLEKIATFKVSDQVNAISRETGQRRVALMVSLKGGSASDWISTAQTKLSKIDLPKGYRVEMGGQFKHYQEATQRLRVVVPMTLILILMLLFAALKSLRHALLVLLCVPTAVTGGVLALALRGMPLTISAVVGFLALSGIAVLNGVMLITYIQQLRRQGVPLEQAVREGTFTRLQPKIMTASVAAAGFIPMAISTGAGAEVQRPLATVVVGGIITSTFLTLVLLPVLFLWIENSTRAKTTR